jgi:hypothetical protein
MNTAGSLFSGVGRLDRAMEALGYEIAWQSEVDSAASAVLAHPDTCLLKTSAPSLFEDSTASSVTLPKSGSMRNGQLYERPMLEHRIDASEFSSLLPTPTATPYGNNQSQSEGAKVRPSLDGLVKVLPTPTASEATGPGEGNRQGGANLRTVIHTHTHNDLVLLPTPTANIATNGGSQPPAKRKAGNHGVSIQDVIEHLGVNTSSQSEDGKQSTDQHPNQPTKKVV